MARDQLINQTQTLPQSLCIELQRLKEIQLLGIIESLYLAKCVQKLLQESQVFHRDKELDSFNDYALNIGTIFHCRFMKCNSPRNIQEIL